MSISLARSGKSHWITIAAGVVLLACTFVAGFGLYKLKQYDLFAADTEDPVIIEGNARITLPDSAQDVHAHVEGFQETFIQTRFVIPSSDLPEFLASTLCNNRSFSTSDIRLLLEDSLDRPWWKPTSAEHFKWCEGSTDSFFQRILIDMSDPNTYIVFMVAGDV
jgi:hypothetical protein